MENQKVNILIRFVKDLKELTRSSSFFEQINSYSQSIQKDPEEILVFIDHFEFNLSLILKRLFEHVEAIQSCDLGLLMDHILTTLRAILDSRFNPDHIELRQEGQVFGYIYGIYRNIEHLNETLIVQWTKDYHLPGLLIEILVEKTALFTSPCKQKILEALGAIADCV